MQHVDFVLFECDTTFVNLQKGLVKKCVKFVNQEMGQEQNEKINERIKV